jgi:phosphatidylserine/phosphatidylglycerophosphate/cardiolipin synthase-like enzyme
MPPYVSCYFSPDRGTADTIIGFIDKCQTHLCAAIYSITHDGIANAVIRAHNRGVQVRILTDKVQAGNRYADDERMQLAGVPVRLDTQPGLMHHKFIAGDENAVGTGSFNWSANADKRNAENFVIVRLKYVVDEFQAEFDRIWELNAPE